MHLSVTRRRFDEAPGMFVPFTSSGSAALWENESGDGPIVRVLPNAKYGVGIDQHQKLFEQLSKFVNVVPHRLFVKDPISIIVAERINGERLDRVLEDGRGYDHADLMLSGFFRYLSECLRQRGNFLVDLVLYQVVLGCTDYSADQVAFLVDVGPEGSRIDRRPSLLQTLHFILVLQYQALEASQVRARSPLPLTDQAVQEAVQSARAELPLWSRPLIPDIHRTYLGRTKKLRPLLRFAFFLKPRGIKLGRDFKMA